YDSESGLNFQRARYYNPATQSFMAQDSKDLVNRYNYADSNPVMNYDPSGHNAISDAFHKGISVLGGKGAVYGLNSAAMLTSLLSAGSLLLLPPSPLSFMVVSAEIISFTAGGSAVFAQAAADYKFFDHQTSQRLHDAADIIGLIDLPFSVVTGATGIANEVAKRVGQVDGVGLFSKASEKLKMYSKTPFGSTWVWLETGYGRFKYKATSLFGPSFEIYNIRQTEKGFSMFIETKRLSVADKLADDGERIFTNSKIQRALAKQHPETSIENIQHVYSTWTKFDVRGPSTEKLKGVKYGQSYTVEVEYELSV
ncbi:RHS repeat-associated core domain-containing protein, partial [Fangia hongkongensis]